MELGILGAQGWTSMKDELFKRLAQYLPGRRKLAPNSLARRIVPEFRSRRPTLVLDPVRVAP
jgi:hypothetical protein